ncbi:leucine-rich repeat-containing protein 40-like [Nymphalis io]|uniref:leucine-rich repeat-containing protein 40-like n=1 Tax=Inachis io TaxID=171585 RepID=UPI0021679B32|nr:leucine-rich repeat-containing protein 40-like [Nymphalis io]
MSRRHTTPTKSRVQSCKKSVFHLQDKKADESELSLGLIKSAKRTGQLSLCNRGLGTVPENVWKINELVLDETKEVDFSRSDQNNWWNAEPLKMLDLSSNVIKTLSPDIKLLQELITLKLHDNALIELPAEFGELSNLSNLSLDHNKLEVLPIEFYKLCELRWLSISHNMLQKIEPDFGDLVMLTFLDLSHNKLSVLPPGMGYLVRLMELNLCHNQLSELPPDIVNLRDLKKLNVSNNNLKKLPPLGELRKMEIFDANHNDIDELPDFYGCTALKEIYLANNFIKEITEEFCDQMQHLNVLNIRDNKLEVLPENISLLKKLKRFDFSNNNLNKLPTNLGLLSQLQSISMEGNKLSCMRQDIIKGGTDRMMKYLRDRMTDEVVKETRVNEANWPDKYTLKKSQALMLPSKELTAIPEDVFIAAADAEVHIVDISKNKFTSVPFGIHHVRETLTQLLLTSNSIESIPSEISVCKHLQYLDLGKNCLNDLPIELGLLKNLRELVISNNKFTKIPRCVYELDNLEILLAADNRIQEINVSSDALARLARLAALDLRNNDIRAVPPELGTFTHLRSLELMGNCFRQPRHAILAKGTASILSYLRDRIPT